MDDVPSLIEAYLAGARQGVAPGGLYVEGDVLYLDGWWQAAFRLATDAYLVQAEPPPSSTHAIEPPPEPIVWTSIIGRTTG